MRLSELKRGVGISTRAQPPLPPKQLGDLKILFDEPQRAIAQRAVRRWYHTMVTMSWVAEKELSLLITHAILKKNKLTHKITRSRWLLLPALLSNIADIVCAPLSTV